METKKLIALLQSLVDEHEPHVSTMGEHSVEIDTWRRKYDGSWHYRGFSPNIVVQKSDDGVYDILCAKESWENLS